MVTAETLASETCAFLVGEIDWRVAQMQIASSVQLLRAKDTSVAASRIAWPLTDLTSYANSMTGWKQTSELLKHEAEFNLEWYGACIADFVYVQTSTNTPLQIEQSLTDRGFVSHSRYIRSLLGSKAFQARLQGRFPPPRLSLIYAHPSPVGFAAAILDSIQGPAGEIASTESENTTTAEASDTFEWLRPRRGT